VSPSSTGTPMPMASNHPDATGNNSGRASYPSPEEEAQARLEQRRARNRQLAAMYRLRTRERFDTLGAQALQGKVDKNFQVAYVECLQKQVRDLTSQLSVHSGCDPIIATYLAAKAARNLIMQCAASQVEGHSRGK